MVLKLVTCDGSIPEPVFLFLNFAPKCTNKSD